MAAELPDGTIQIVDVDESRADLDAFATSTLFPAFEAAGVMTEVMARPAPTAYDAVSVQRG